jgi:hypothetical protein
LMTQVNGCCVPRTVLHICPALASVLAGLAVADW